uniref:Cysteine-rich receptor-like protein kinase 10 n=1 Tax=Cajanus cajan TaxID=3821 RepID=A0A151S229_CAJCA|nr:Cysteine-rich receptor-like protein kinase 10 [Cajanus cajan]
MKDPDTLSSKDGNFTLGFFTPQNSTKRYVGIWWKSESTVIWVANRDQPLNDSSGVVTISEDSNLVVLNGQKQVIWSTNVSNITSNASSQFSDSGKLVLTETTRGTILWDSFQQPSNSLLPSMKLSLNIRIGEKVELTSWKSPSNPSVGSFSLSLVQRINIIEVFIWNETRPFWRSGPWSGGVFKGIPTMSTYLDGFKGGDDGEGNANIYYTVPTDTEFVVYILNSQGRFEQTWWDDEKKGMEVTWTSRKSDCDVYGMCGPFASCNSQRSPICSCLKGFEPRNKEEWNRQNWTSGCVRRTRLKCERVKDQNTKLSQVKLQELLLFDFERVATVTNNFHLSNKLGQGGFGPVYKGKLQDGQEIAVKRLSRASGQGLEEFMNEVVVISKLQHRNLVRLFGCCVEGDEKMLIYEYLPNKSLDVFVFDPSKSKLLDWSKRCSIIEGIARGLLYLHRDSRLRIIHRDLKASNILLDEEMNPKISDFGMARIFGGSEDEANTKRVVGT